MAPQWTSSEPATQGTSFLDLPREIRDYIYQEMCKDFKREGLRWDDTAPIIRGPGVDVASLEAHYYVTNQPHEDQSDYEARMELSKPAVFSDCAIMATCQQLHFEFAGVLYSMPMHISYVYGRELQDHLPIAYKYTGFVRSVFAEGTSIDPYNNEFTWAEQLQFARDISKVFPNAHVIRLAWYTSQGTKDPAIRLARGPATWDVMVKAIVEVIKKLEQGILMGKNKIPFRNPSNLEVVQLLGTQHSGHSWPNLYSEVRSVLTPVTEAVRIVQREDAAAG